MIVAGLRRDLARTVGLALAVAVGVATASLVLALHAGAQAALSRWVPAVDRSLTVEPPRLGLGGLGARLDDVAVGRLRGLPGVERVIPRMIVRVPAMSQYHGAFFGRRLDLAVEIAAEGVEASALSDALSPEERFSWKPGAVLPACVSEGLLAIYNVSFAPMRGLPALDARLLRGFELPVTIGASLVGTPSTSAESLTVRIVCVAPDAMIAGLTLPLEAARELNRRHGVDAESYSSATIVARAPEALPELERGVTELGLRVDETAQATGRRLGRALQLVTLAFVSLSVLMLALAVGLVALSFASSLHARAGEQRLLRALGATRSFLARQGAVEAVVIGALGAGLGLVLAVGCSPLVQSLAAGAGFPGSGPVLRFTLVAVVGPAALGVASPCVGAALAALGSRRRRQFV